MDETLTAAMKGNADAVRLVESIVDIFHVWDDLIDRDRTPTDREINDAFTRIFIALPLNRFYAANFQQLHPIVLAAIISWRIATEMERIGTEAEKSIAFIIRSAYVDIAIQCAAIIGGMEWAVKVGLDLRRSVHGEGWNAYLLNLAAEKEKREGVVCAA